MKRESKQILALGIVAFLLYIPVLVFLYFFAGLFVFDFEGMNYQLSDGVHALAREIKQYEQENGVYPERVLDIKASNKLCVEKNIRLCRRVHYKVTENKQEFRMAVRSFTWSILYYHPEMSMTTEELKSLSEGEKKEITNRYGKICFYCEAHPWWTKYLDKDDSPALVYKEDSKVFEQPELWPRL